MRLRVVMPQLETNLPRGVVAKWHVAEGDAVSFGEPICDLDVSERIRLNPVRRADALIKLSRKKGKYVEESETEKERFVVTYQVVASERSTIIRHVVPVGGTVEIGELLAIADSDADPQPGAPDEDVSSAPTLRVVARLREPDQAF